MALKDRVEARYSTERIKQWTNPQKTGSGAKDDGRLDNAVEAAISDFRVYVGKVYDDDNEAHRNIAVDGVVVHLKVWADQRGSDKEFDRYLNRLKALARTEGGRDRILPVIRTPEGEPVEPIFTARRFEDLTPDPPRDRGQDDDNRLE